MSARTFKIVAVSYLVKTLVVGIAWLAVPDLPQRTAAGLRAAWAWLTSSQG